MAVTVIDRRITVNDADDITGWNQGEAVTTFFAEAPACISVGNDAPEQIYFTDTARNLTSTLIYVYAFNNGLQNDWDDPTNPPVGLLIGDGTNQVSFNMAGDNKKVFVHSDGPTAWQNLILDTDVIGTLNTNGYTTVRAGSFANLNVGSLTQFGVDLESLSKALGGGFNMACDIIRVGNDGLRIVGGTVGDEGKLIEIAIEDRSTLTGKAHGMVRELIAGTFGCQGPLTFGDSTTATNSIFLDNGVILAYEARDVGNDKYYFNVEGNVGSTNEFTLINSTITTAGPFVTCDFSTGNVDLLDIEGTTFSDLGNSITFSNLTDSTNHFIESCTFNGCGQIDPGTVSFTGNTISDSTNLDGALLLDVDGSSNMSDLTFNRGSGGHGIIVTATGTYDFNSFTFNGFGLDETTESAIYNNSGGSVTINVLGGTPPPTVRNGTGSTTTLNQLVSVTLTNLREDTEVRVFDAATSNPQTELVGIESATAGTFDDREFTFSLNAGQIVDIIVHSVVYESLRIENFTVPSSNSTFPVDQRFDRNYFNPNN